MPEEDNEGNKTKLQLMQLIAADRRAVKIELRSRNKLTVPTEHKIANTKNSLKSRDKLTTLAADAAKSAIKSLSKLKH